ncbi:MAG: cytochrome c biogenesis protein ResB [Planctomycetota bacterium]
MTHIAGLKNRLRRFVLCAGLILILLLTMFSIYGAFLGAERAQRFFNSIPLSIYWGLFAVLLVAGIVLFGRLLYIRGLFLIHLGCILVLAGAMWGSKAGIKIQDALFGSDTTRAGQMVVYEGMTQKSVKTEDNGQKELPFTVKLVDFKIEYYQPGSLLIQTTGGDSFKIEAVPGTEFSIGDDYGSVEIIRLFENFKLFFEGDKHVAIDDPNGKPNPAVELLLKRPDGSQVTRYAFERFEGHVNLNDKLAFSYRRAIRDFISDLEVIKEGKVLARKSIEVNKPLHYDGYFFYQQGYDDEAGQYSILRVTTDKGLMTVYLGFLLLCTGAFWHLWLRHILGDREMDD